MIYCKKCSRLLEKESDVCPYCGDAEDTGGQQSVDEQMNELNSLINERNEKSEQSGSPEQIITEDTPPRQAYAPERPDMEITTGMRVLYILLSVFIAPAGIIVGAIFMSRDSRAYRSLGKTMLIISIIAFVLCIICCCALYMLIVGNMADLYPYL